MELWTIEYWHDAAQQSSVEHWLDKLTAEQFKSAAKEIKLLEACGNTLKLPHSRCLKHGLFELRERRYGYRIYYAFWHTQTIVLLTAGNKSTQKHDMIFAREQLNKMVSKEL